MPKIGLSNFCYAVVKTDTKEGTTYEKFKEIPGLIEANVKSNSKTTTLYADNGAYASASALGEITMDINLADLPDEDAQIIMGHEVKNGVMVYKTEDHPADIAVGYEILMDGGKHKRTWLLKGMFAEPDDNNKTKEDSVTYNTQSATGTFKMRISDGLWKVSAMEGDTSLKPGVYEAFLSLETLNTIKEIITAAGGAGA